MNLGICTRYSSHEATYAAITIGNWAAAHDISVSMFSVAPRAVSIERRWDAIVQITRRCKFAEWAQRFDAILWTHCPHYEQLRWCQQKKMRAIIFSLWHELDVSHRPVYQQADIVLSPSQIAAGMLRSRWQVGRSIPLPLDLNLPVFHKVAGSPVKLLLPLFDGAARRMEMTVLEILDRLLATYPQLLLTVAYNSSTLAAYAYQRLRSLRNTHGPRLQRIPGIPWRDRPLLFMNHDLTIWPTQAESTGIVGLMSLAMGSPLVCFACPPVDEIVNDRNALLVPCGIDYSPQGATMCRPDYAAFEEILHQGLKNPDTLRRLQQMTAADLPRRQQDFSATLGRALS